MVGATRLAASCDRHVPGLPGPLLYDRRGLLLDLHLPVVHPAVRVHPAAPRARAPRRLARTLPPGGAHWLGVVARVLARALVLPARALPRGSAEQAAARPARHLSRGQGWHRHLARGRRKVPEPSQRRSSAGKPSQPDGVRRQPLRVGLPGSCLQPLVQARQRSAPQALRWLRRRQETPARHSHCGQRAGACQQGVCHRHQCHHHR
mmetsp:Transcript_50278/g.139603  ORF Transcript_50278/g.139603 Transcript_50278/m.139603 type:complete len:206 (-) Transcript_50278:1602-2219(-)